MTYKRWGVMSLAATALLLTTVAPVCAVIDIAENTTLTPVPEIVVDPNEGQTYGVLAAILMTDDDQRLQRIIAPDVRYNSVTGVYPTIRLFEYSLPRQDLYLEFGKATRIGEYLEATYAAERLLDGWLDLDARGEHEVDPFERFFGFGNDTPSADETNYTSKTNGLRAAIGFNLPYALRLRLQTRVRVVRVRRGGIDDLTQLVDDPQFAGTPGLDGATIVGQTFGLQYDTRNSRDITTDGSFARAGIEVIDQALGSSVSFLKLGLDGRSYLPLDAGKRFVLALQGVVDYISNAAQAPFYERNAIGGVSSLRGFGSNRYIDNHRCFVRSELRSNVWTPAMFRDWFNVNGHVEFAPFFELGQVFHSAQRFPLDDPHFVGGMGVRAAIPPEVLAYVDVGTAGSAPAIFTGIDYPF